MGRTWNNDQFLVGTVEFARGLEGYTVLCTTRRSPCFRLLLFLQGRQIVTDVLDALLCRSLATLNGLDFGRFDLDSQT